MRLRVVLIALLVVATAAFVAGVSIERSQGEDHDEPATAVEGEGEAGEPAAAGHEEGAESGEAVPGEESPGAQADEEKAEKFLGIDYEAVPFIALVAAFSLVLAAAVWLLPGSVPVLALVVVAMVAFAALDVREAVHQLDEDNGGLALLAGVVAALHLGVAAMALALARGAAAAGRPLA